jgi:hypothetical protein
LNAPTHIKPVEPEETGSSGFPAFDMADLLTARFPSRELRDLLHLYFPATSRADVYWAVALAMAMFEVDLIVAEAERDEGRREMAELKRELAELKNQLAELEKTLNGGRQ